MSVRSPWLWSVFAIAWLGCGNPSSGDDDDEARDAGIDATDCTQTGCATEAVCNPQNGQCEPIPCNMHSDCPDTTYCAPTGVCSPSNTGGPCDDDSACTNGETCVGGFCACRGQTFQAEGVPPNVLIVLDRSGSMSSTIGGMTKWAIAVASVNTMLANYGTQVRFGLNLFEPPTSGSCAAGQVMVDVGPSTTSQIMSALSATGPGGTTPIGGTLAALATYQPLRDSQRENYVLLLTDGEESCGGNGTAAATALRGQTPEVKTFVVGFGSGVDASELEAIAVAGGTGPATGGMHYYQADDAASLATVFEDIGAAVLSCSYALTGAPDEDTMFVRFDGTTIPRDPTHINGWDYDSATNTLTFYGAACTSLRTGDVIDLVVGSGCSVG